MVYGLWFKKENNMIFVAQGNGHIHPTKAQKERLIELETELVNYTYLQCKCGYGCEPHMCQKSKRHWFLLPAWMHQNPNVIFQNRTQINGNV